MSPPATIVRLRSFSNPPRPQLGYDRYPMVPLSTNSARNLTPQPPTTGLSTTPTRLRWLIENVVSSDGHRLTVGFTCTAALVDQKAERQLFAEVFGSTSSGNNAVLAHFQPALGSAAAELARNNTAEQLLALPAREQWVATLKAAANEIAFSCGIEVLAPFEVEVTSPSLQQERMEQMQRVAAERRSVDRMGHLTRAAELLKQWESLKADIPSITPGKLLEQINPADRGLMLDTLLMASAGGVTSQVHSDLWAVSGSQLVRMDVRLESPHVQLIALPSTIGPLRSVKTDSGKLWIGARNGVMVIDPANTAAPTLYGHPTLASEYGFTSVTPIANMVWACHREGGLVGWDSASPAQPAMVFSPAGLGSEPRHLTSNGLFAAGTKLFRISSSGLVKTPFTAAASIVAILPSDNQTIIVDEAGGITILDDQSLEQVDQLSAGGKLTSAALLPWLTTARLLLNRAEGPIECIGLEDQLVTRFGGSQTGMRAITASSGKIAAMSNDRQRVLLWNAWDGRATSSEIYLTGTTRHRIADLTFD